MSDLGNKEVFSRNLKYMMQRHGKDRNQVCADLGFKYTTFTDWYNGNKYPRIDKIELLANYFGVKKSDLIEAHGVSSPDITSDVVTFSVEAGVAAHYDAMPDVDNIAPEQIDIPRAYLHGRSKDDYCAMRVNGQSMFPDYHDGDIVLVLKTRTLDRPGQVGVIRYGEGAMTIKRIDYVPGEDWLELVPINPTCAPERISGADLEQCEVVGVPKMLIRTFRE